MGIKADVKVDILFGEAGAEEAARREAVTVVIDALRASATITTALAVGAQKVVPVGTPEEARAYLGRPGHFVAGERRGMKLPGFHFGNSPTELVRHGHLLRGGVLVLTTTNGTRVVRAARAGNTVILAGTTLNAGAVARAALEMARREGRDIVLVAAGEDEAHAEEDFAGARCIAGHLERLQNTPVACEPCPADLASLFAETPSAQELFELGYRDDVFFCARRDVYEVVPWLKNGGFVAYGTHQAAPIPRRRAE